MGVEIYMLACSAQHCTPVHLLLGLLAPACILREQPPLEGVRGNRGHIRIFQVHLPFSLALPQRKSPPGSEAFCAAGTAAGVLLTPTLCDQEVGYWESSPDCLST